MKPIDYQPNPDDFETDEFGQYLKADRLHPVLEQFPNGNEASRFFQENDEMTKVYLISSMNGNTNV